MENDYKKEFIAYEEVRLSGKTNMFHVSKVEFFSGLSEEKILEIQKNYSALRDAYLPQRIDNVKIIASNQVKEVKERP